MFEKNNYEYETFLTLILAGCNFLRLGPKDCFILNRQNLFGVYKLNCILYLYFSFGFNGHICMLKMICEMSQTALEHNGLMGQLLHILLT